MRRTLLGAVFLLALAPALTVLHAQDKAKADTPAAQLKALTDEDGQIRLGISKALKEAKTNEEKQKLVKEASAKIMALPGRYLELAKKYPADPAAVEALARAAGSRKPPEAGQAVEILLKDYATHENAGAACEPLAASTEPGAEKFLRAVLEKNQHAKAQGYAAYSLAVMLKNRARRPGLPAEELSKLRQEFEQLYERVEAKHADLRTARGETIGAIAKRELFEMRNLAIGKEAPNIEGEDADGKKFKLSDYRGKVVVLDFWASWCGPCMAMVPHERELVKRLEGKPFALIGVNLDTTKELLKKTEEQHKMSWRSFFDGRGGQIAKQWNIQFIPTIYVLDHKGVIRHTGVRGKAMDEAVEALLKEVPSAQ